MTPILDWVNISYYEDVYTDGLGRYNLTFKAPDDFGNYNVTVTSIYTGISGRNESRLIVTT